MVLVLICVCLFVFIVVVVVVVVVVVIGVDVFIYCETDGGFTTIFVVFVAIVSCFQPLKSSCGFFQGVP